MPDAESLAALDRRTPNQGPVMLIATWIGAVATVLAVGAGLSFTAYYAKQAFEKQSLEVRTLEN